MKGASSISLPVQTFPSESLTTQLLSEINEMRLTPLDSLRSFTASRSLHTNGGSRTTSRRDFKPKVLQAEN